MSMSIMEMEPNIVKAQFMVTNTRIYTLEFDQNIQMKELKTMIRVAAHLRKNNFRLFSDGKEYTQYHEETFDSLFPGENIVAFTLQKGEGEVFDEAELLIQINSPCPHHAEKFLLFYCFDCNCSICCDCFLIGTHKNHHVQDKCYYLLPSKFLVAKMFQSWNINPEYDFKINADLSELKKKINNVYFTQLFQKLKDVQMKCNDLLDNYNNVNINSYGNIRDSMKEIKVSCIKALDDLKEKIKIKDIVNNPQIFKEFDIAYKQLGKKMNEKFKQNIEIFKKLNLQVSFSVSNLIEKIFNLILKTLEQALDEKQYYDIKLQINEKIILPVDRNAIINQFN